MTAAKAWVATAGAAVTSALALAAPDTGVWTTLTILSAALTAAGVYFFPNKEKYDLNV